VAKCQTTVIRIDPPGFLDYPAGLPDGVKATPSPINRRMAQMRSRLPDIAIMTVGWYAEQLDRTHPRRNPANTTVRQEKIRAVRRLERVLVVGNFLFQSIKKIEQNWRTEVLDGRTSYDPNEDRSIAEMYSQWSAPCARCHREIERFRSNGIRVRGSKEFDRHCVEAEEILSGVREPFKNPATATRWREIVAASRPNPRHVRLDATGRILEMSGERFEMPGLEPEAILEGLADEEAGRIFPLSQIIADRK
jgi:hypothetical protein